MNVSNFQQYAFVKQFAADPTNTVIGIVRNKVATEKKLRDDNITGVMLFEADIVDLVTLKVCGSVYMEGGQMLIMDYAGNLNPITRGPHRWT